MKQEVKRRIGESEYTFYQFNASQGLKVWVKLVKVLGAPLGVVINNLVGKEKKGLDKIDLKELSLDTAVQMLANNIDADDTVELIKEICSTVLFEGKRVNEIFDVHFQGQYTQLFEVLYVALEVNYKDFLLGLAGKAGLSKEA